MFFDISFKPELCASDDPTLSTLENVELVRESRGGKETYWLVATDGRTTLVKVPVSDAEGDALGPISPGALDAARKLARKAKSGVGEIRCGLDTLTLSDGSTLPRPKRPEHASFPDYQRVIPPTADLRPLDKVLFEASKENPGPYVLKLGLDAERLMQAVKAQGRKGVVEILVTIQPPTVEEKESCTVTGPLVLRAPDGVLAVVMPGRVKP